MRRFFFLLPFLIAAPVYAADLNMRVTTIQSSTGEAQDEVFILQLYPQQSSGSWAVGQFVPGYTAWYAIAYIRLHGYQPMSGGFWYRILKLDTSTTNHEVLHDLGGWKRGTVDVWVDADYQYRVELHLAETTVSYIIRDSDPGIISDPSDPAAVGYNGISLGDFDSTHATVDQFVVSETYIATWLGPIDLIGLGGAGGLGGSSGPGGGEEEPGETGVELPTGDTDYAWADPGSAGAIVWSQRIQMIEGITPHTWDATTGDQTGIYTVEMKTDYYTTTTIKPIVDNLFLGFCGLIAFMLPYRTLLRKH